MRMEDMILVSVDDHVCVPRECDYPHSDTTWPRAPERLWKSLAGVSDADVDKITWQNVVRWFSYDPFEHIAKEQCTVGALCAQTQHVDLSVPRGGGGKKPSDYARGYATIGDIMRQMAGAFSTVDSGKDE